MHGKCIWAERRRSFGVSPPTTRLVDTLLVMEGCKSIGMHARLSTDAFETWFRASSSLKLLYLKRLPVTSVHCKLSRSRCPTDNANDSMCADGAKDTEGRC